jgi:hypothetical protein
LREGRARAWRPVSVFTFPSLTSGF